MKINYIRNCGDVKTNVITIQENATFGLSTDCEVIPNFCLDVAGFSSATIKYQAWKSNLPVRQREIDFCDIKSKFSAEDKARLKIFGLPFRCPIEKVCVYL